IDPSLQGVVADELNVAPTGFAGAGAGIRAAIQSRLLLAEQLVRGAVRVGSRERLSADEGLLRDVHLPHRQPVQEVAVPGRAGGTGGGDQGLQRRPRAWWAEALRTRRH